jgi:hypothetical protein
LTHSLIITIIHRIWNQFLTISVGILLNYKKLGTSEKQRRPADALIPDIEVYEIKNDVWHTFATQTSSQVVSDSAAFSFRNSFYFHLEILFYIIIKCLECRRKSFFKYISICWNFLQIF